LTADDLREHVIAADEVVHKLPNIPVRARRRDAPLVVVHAGDELTCGLNDACQLIDRAVAHERHAIWADGPDRAVLTTS
jgi:hypothetical protein